MKKILTAMAVCVLVAGLTATTAYAHGGRGANRSNVTSTPACTVENCAEVGVHRHDGTSYRCSKQNCTLGANCGGAGGVCTGGRTGNRTGAGGHGGGHGGCRR